MNIVLVHGGLGRRLVLERRHRAPCQAAGHHVTAPQFPGGPRSPDDRRPAQARTRAAGRPDGWSPGTPYGGQIITALGTDAPNAAALVYIAAFGLDEGEDPRARCSARGRPPLARSRTPFTDSPRLRLAPRGTTSSLTSPPASTPDRAPGAARRTAAPWPGRRSATVMGAPRVESRCRRGTWSRSRTRRSRQTASGCSPSAWARPPSRVAGRAPRDDLPPRRDERGSSSRPVAAVPGRNGLRGERCHRTPGGVSRTRSG